MYLVYLPTPSIRLLIEFINIIKNGTHSVYLVYLVYNFNIIL